ncbi:hypothetical protein L0152_31260, partial [bacterium]|nr:hypothetical protein [bacterium]
LSGSRKNILICMSTHPASFRSVTSAIPVQLSRHYKGSDAMQKVSLRNHILLNRMIVLIEVRSSVFT